MRLWKSPARAPAAAAIVVAAAALVAAGCGKNAGGSTAQAGGAASAVAVSVAPAVRGEIARTVDVDGSLKALQDVAVGARVAGKLASVSLNEGDPVSAGQVVAAMDVVDFQSQLQQARANVEVAVTRREQADAALAQARSGLQSAQTSLAMVRTSTAAELSSAQKDLQTAQERQAVVLQGARTQERQQAVDAVASAKATYERTKSDLQRYKKLAQEQAISQSQLDSAQAAYDAAQAAYSSAQQALSLVQAGARPEERRQAALAVEIAQQEVVRAQADRDQVKLREADVANAKTGVVAAQAGVQAAVAGVDQAHAALHIAQYALDNAYVRSPITGYVAQRVAEPGQQLGAGGVIMRIVAPKSIYFEAVVSESQFHQVRRGERATITVDALPGKKIEGAVTRILPVASASSRSFLVRVDFPIGDLRLRPEMFARGSILIATHAGATLIPKDAVLYDPSTNIDRVFVVGKDGKASERKVRLGYVNTERVEALSGVRPGEKVVIAGQNVLQNGDPVKVQ